MAAADKHIPILLPMLQKDSRFTNITVQTFTGYNGSLYVAGMLPSESDLENLKQIIELSKPPVRVVYHVDILPSELIQDLIKAKNEAH